MINSARVLATLIIRPEAQNQFVGRSMQPLMSLVNLMKHREKVGGTELDQVELVANGLKILRVLSADRDQAVNIADGFNLCIDHVLDLIEEHFGSRTIKDEGREVIANLSRFQVLTDAFKIRSRKILEEGQKLPKTNNDTKE